MCCQSMKSTGYLSVNVMLCLHRCSSPINQGRCVGAMFSNAVMTLILRIIYRARHDLLIIKNSDAMEILSDT